MTFSYGFSMDTPLGCLLVQGTEEAIQFMKFIDGDVGQLLQGTDLQQPGWMQSCQQQLNEYFAGLRSEFSLPIDPQGTEFQKQVWGQLVKVRTGELSSYQQLATACDNPKAVRAVASANANNPIWILIPCHRIIGSDSALRGYAGGLERKAELLKLEGHELSQQSDFNEKTRVLS